MINNLAALIKVKSILTLIMAVVFAVLSLRGDINGAEFLAVFTTVIGFYFGTQHEKNTSEASVTDVTDTITTDDVEAVD